MKISVAIATYNGEKYIKEQIQSILNQTFPVDEIIISDDGSKDTTLKIVQSMAKEDARIKISTDNPRQGYCGNFEHALKKCTGEYIFLSDQDDVWSENKVERVISMFRKYPHATCVFHSGVFIDKNNIRLEGALKKYPVEKLERNDYLEAAVSSPLANGMVMCISKELLEEALPFPKMKGCHDQWLLFCSLCKDSCYYLDEELTGYRLHGENTAGNPVYKGTIVNRINKIYRKLKNHSNETIDFLVLGTEMKNKLKEVNLISTKAYKTAERVCEIGYKQKEAFDSKRFIGAYKLCKLYITDVRYRKSGTKDFLYQFVGILIK